MCSGNVNKYWECGRLIALNQHAAAERELLEKANQRVTVKRGIRVAYFTKAIPILAFYFFTLTNVPRHCYKQLKRFSKNIFKRLGKCIGRLAQLLSSSLLVPEFRV